MGSGKCWPPYAPAYRIDDPNKQCRKGLIKDLQDCAIPVSCGEISDSLRLGNPDICANWGVNTYWSLQRENGMCIHYEDAYEDFDNCPGQLSVSGTNLVLNIFTQGTRNSQAELVSGIYDRIKENQYQAQRIVDGIHMDGRPDEEAVLDFPRNVVQLSRCSKIFALIMVGEQYDWKRSSSDPRSIPKPEVDLRLEFYEINRRTSYSVYIKRSDVERDVKCTKYFRVVPINISENGIPPGNYIMTFKSTGPGYVIGSLFVSSDSRTFDPRWISNQMIDQINENK
jgi:hypothetical protein